MKQYRRNTNDRFRLCSNNCDLKDKEIKQKSLHKLFLKDDGRGFEEDVNICLNDKTDHPVAQK